MAVKIYKTTGTKDANGNEINLNALPATLLNTPGDLAYYTPPAGANGWKKAAIGKNGDILGLYGIGDLRYYPVSTETTLAAIGTTTKQQFHIIALGGSSSITLASTPGGYTAGQRFLYEWRAEINGGDVAPNDVKFQISVRLASTEVANFSIDATSLAGTPAYYALRVYMVRTVTSASYKPRVFSWLHGPTGFTIGDSHTLGEKSLQTYYTAASIINNDNLTIMITQINGTVDGYHYGINKFYLGSNAVVD